MEFLMFWFLSTLAVFLVMLGVFQIDEKHADGSFRDLIEDFWVLAIILLAVPLINILACLVGVVIFIVILIAVKMDDHNMDGEKILKKIFFIKDDK